MLLTREQAEQAQKEGWKLIGSNNILPTYTPDGRILFRTLLDLYHWVWHQGHKSEFHAAVIQALGANHPCATAIARMHRMNPPNLVTYLERNPSDPLAKTLAVKLATDNFVEAAGEINGYS